MRLLCALVLVLSVGACNYAVSDIATVPANPTYDKDVRPLLADHCLLCHGARPDRGSPSYLRLDVYDDENNILGAKSEGERILFRVQQGTMPPAARNGDGVGPNGTKMLENWVNNGKPR